MKEQIIKKLTSRKFWVTIVGIAAGVLVAFGGDTNEIVEIAGIVGSIIASVTYVLAEASIDRENVKKEG